MAFGGPDKDAGCWGLESADGGYIVPGWTGSFGAGGYDVYVVKTDGEGNEVWSKTYGDRLHNYGHSIQQTSDGGYIITGQTGSRDVYLIKIDSAGNQLWSRSFDERGEDYAKSVRQTSDGGYIIAGYSNWASGCPACQALVIKTDQDGSEMWRRVFGETGSFAQDIQQTADDGYVIAGRIKSGAAGGLDGYVIRVDQNGKELWCQTYGDQNGNQVRSIQQTSDGGYIVAGCLHGNTIILKLAPGSEPSVPFRRGDSNADGRMNIGDGVYILQNLFGNGPAISCRDAADANDDETVNVADAVYILYSLFARGPAIPSPYPECGVDITLDELGCVEYQHCEP